MTEITESDISQTLVQIATAAAGSCRKLVDRCYVDPESPVQAYTVAAKAMMTIREAERSWCAGKITTDIVGTVMGWTARMFQAYQHLSDNSAPNLAITATSSSLQDQAAKLLHGGGPRLAMAGVLVAANQAAVALLDRGDMHNWVAYGNRNWAESFERDFSGWLAEELSAAVNTTDPTDPLRESLLAIKTAREAL